jgi:hypothetical protein
MAEHRFGVGVTYRSADVAGGSFGWGVGLITMVVLRNGRVEVAASRLCRALTLGLGHWLARRSVYVAFRHRFEAWPIGSRPGNRAWRLQPREPDRYAGETYLVPWRTAPKLFEALREAGFVVEELGAPPGLSQTLGQRRR